MQRIQLPNLCRFLFAIALTAYANVGFGDGPADNVAENVRPIPPQGIEIDDATREALTWRCKAIRTQWKAIIDTSAKQPGNQGERLRSLECEVLVFPRAVELALEFNQFYKTRDLELASRLLDEASRRLSVVNQGGDWKEVVGLESSTKKQLIVGGFRSSIDGSYQPYGLVVPPGIGPEDQRPRRLRQPAALPADARDGGGQPRRERRLLAGLRVPLLPGSW